MAGLKSKADLGDAGAYVHPIQYHGHGSARRDVVQLNSFHSCLLANYTFALLCFREASRSEDVGAHFCIPDLLLLLSLRFLPFLLVSVCGNWLLARLFHRHEKKSIITFGIAFNLILIAGFKYLDFPVASLASLFGQDHASWGIILPLGISFFTFQQISYLVDPHCKYGSLYPFPS